MGAFKINATMMWGEYNTSIKKTKRQFARISAKNVGLGYGFSVACSLTCNFQCINR